MYPSLDPTNNVATQKVQYASRVLSILNLSFAFSTADPELPKFICMHIGEGQVSYCSSK